MKVVGINGSPRKDGNTAILIRTVLAELNAEGIDTELIFNTLIFNYFFKNSLSHRRPAYIAQTNKKKRYHIVISEKKEFICIKKTDLDDSKPA